MMDWVAKMLGLDASFHNASNAGGGIIMVGPPSPRVLSPRSAGLTSRTGIRLGSLPHGLYRCARTGASIAAGDAGGEAGDLWDYADALAGG